MSPAPLSPRRQLRCSYLGKVRYLTCWELQERLRAEVRSGGGPEHLLLLEHDPVFTVGRNASEAEVLADRQWLHDRGVEVHRTNRGGRVTYHGPGQLVGYPIIDLSPDRRDVRRYVRDLQEVLIQTLAELGVKAQRGGGPERIGVWVGEEKIASIGVHLARWVTLHGFALNVSTELAFFSGIVSCGLPGVRMTSIERLTGAAPTLPDVARRLARRFAEVFDRQLVTVPPSAVMVRDEPSVSTLQP